MPAWRDVPNMIYRYILPSAFSKSCRWLRIFQCHSFPELASGMPSNALLLCSILIENHSWMGIVAMLQRKLTLPVEAAQLVTSYTFLSLFFSCPLSSFSFLLFCHLFLVVIVGTCCIVSFLPSCRFPCGSCGCSGFGASGDCYACDCCGSCIW